MMDSLSTSVHPAIPGCVQTDLEKGLRAGDKTSQHLQIIVLLKIYNIRCYDRVQQAVLILDE